MAGVKPRVLIPGLMGPPKTPPHTSTVSQSVVWEHVDQKHADSWAAPIAGGEAWVSALLIGAPPGSYADECWKLLSQIWESSAKTFKCIFPGKAIRDPDAGLTPLTRSAW